MHMTRLCMYAAGHAICMASAAVLFGCCRRYSDCSVRKIPAVKLTVSKLVKVSWSDLLSSC